MKTNQFSNFVEDPVISIVIPSYNREHTIKETINSIINQNFDLGFEVIIGDDCSYDNSLHVIRDYQKKFPNIIKIIEHEKNIGLGANWAICIKECRGKYICNCDNDDYWHNHDKLKLQFEFMESNPFENVVITNHRNHNRNTGKITEEKAWIDESIPLQQAFFQGKQRFCNATIMYRADFLKKHLNLDDFIKYQFNLQDWNTWIILSAYTNFAIMPISTATFGIETESITRPQEYENVIKRFIKEKECYRYVCKLFSDDLKYDEIGYDIYVNGVLLGLAYKRRDVHKAKEFATNMLRLGDKSVRTRFSTNWIGFWIWLFLKSFK